MLGADCLEFMVMGIGAIEKTKLLFAVHQTNVFILAMDLDQQITQFRQLLQGYRTAVDPCPGAPAVADQAAQQAARSDIEFCISQPGQSPASFGQFKFGVELGFGGAGTDGRSIGPVALKQTQGVNQDGFSGSCFTGDRGETATEFQIKCFNNGKVTNL